MKNIISTFTLMLFSLSLISQVGINSNGSQPDQSAMLDVKSTSKGMLIPRMTTIERQTIENPAQGLMVYDQSTNAFYYFNGIGWLELLSGTVKELKDANGDTKIQVEESVDDDVIRFDIEGIERLKLAENRIEVLNNGNNFFIGEESGNTALTGQGNIGIGPNTLDSLTSGYYNIALGIDALKNNRNAQGNFAAGYRAMMDNTTGRDNIAMGWRTLSSNISGRDNVAIGYFVLPENTSGSHNIAFGNIALRYNTTGIQNMAIGNSSMFDNTTGNNNVAYGNFSLPYNTTGDNNVAIGNTALEENITGSRNTALGSYADVISSNLRKATAIGSEAQVGCDNCLVLGEIDSIRVGIGTSYPDEKLHVIGKLKLVDGNQQNGYVLTSDADGLASWSSVSSVQDNQILSFDGTNLTIEDGNTVDLSGVNTVQSIIADDDNDTKIQVEEGVDEDIIRFDIEGSEKLIIHTAGSNNYPQLVFKNNGANILIGESAGDSLINGSNNLAIGNSSLTNNISGSSNNSLGFSSLISNTSGDKNVALGGVALYANESGNSNIGIGNAAGWTNQNGSENVLIGEDAGYGMGLHSKNRNVMIGHQSGVNNEGNNNVFLGYMSGNNESGSNRLYIESSNSSSPLIYGEFDNDLVRINGDLEITGNFPSSNVITDQDADTKIQVEESSNDDAIRFDIAGSEFVKMADGSIEIFNNDNVFIGEKTGNSTVTAGGNVGIGSFNLESLTSGSYNVALGIQSLQSNQSGNDNVAIGEQVLFANQNGEDNVGIGSRSLQNNISGSGNVAIGKNTLRDNTVGIDNIAIGDSSLDGNTSGVDNIAIGDGAGSSNKQGRRNIFIGTGANAIPSEDSLINAIAIGYQTQVHQDNSLILGNSNDVGIGTSTPQEKLHVVGNILLDDGNAQNGYVLTSDANGVGTWQQGIVNSDEQELSYSDANKTLTIEHGNTVNLSNLSQEIAFDGSNLSITNGNSVDISSVDTDTDDQTLSFNTSNNILSIADGNNVNLSELDKDQQSLSYNDNTQSISISGGNTLDLTNLAVPIGSIMMWYTSTPPTGWLICDGSNVPSQYTELSGILGGSLPDLEGRFVLGAGERPEGSNHALLSSGGLETVVLQENNIPEHNHDVTISYREGDENGGGKDYSDLGADSQEFNASKTYTTSDWGGASNGLTSPHQNMPPFLTLHYIIKAQ